ncbi:MAG TPA: maleylpyruvate isomerase family mycothiol-dependent enzyme [Steroidobacteraceae bacterium]|jgi:uncharacterized protein (TIGR03083 family)
MVIAAQTRLDASVRIAVFEPLRAVNTALLSLLDGFGADDWNRPTIHKDRSVKDLAAHLLHGSIRRVLSRTAAPELENLFRDINYRPPAPRNFLDAEQLTRFIQEDNRAFMNAMSGVTPRVIRELIGRYDPELVRLFESLDQDAPGLGVVWAGQWQSPTWFDIAREYTEKWHHQQQLRDATGRPPLYDRALLVPALEIFARGLPYAYRRLRGTDGAAISIFVEAPADIAWTLRSQGGAWSLWRGSDRSCQTSVTVSPDLLWRVWTKGVPLAEAEESLTITGSLAHAAPLLAFVAIMA